MNKQVIRITGPASKVFPKIAQLASLYPSTTIGELATIPSPLATGVQVRYNAPNRTSGLGNLISDNSGVAA